MILLYTILVQKSLTNKSDFINKNSLYKIDGFYTGKYIYANY